MIFKEHWNKHGIQINNWMVDCSPTKIFALQNVFIDSRVFMCDFHCIQSWNRWLKTKTNGSLDHYYEIISILKRLGSATTIEQFKKVQNELYANDHFKKSKRLQKYYGHWRDCKEVGGNLGALSGHGTALNDSSPFLMSNFVFQKWVLAYRVGRGMYDLTNNGLERMNYSVKARFLGKHVNNALSDLINILLRCFIPTLLKM